MLGLTVSHRSEVFLLFSYMSRLACPAAAAHAGSCVLTLSSSECANASLCWGSSFSQLVWDVVGQQGEQTAQHAQSSAVHWGDTEPSPEQLTQPFCGAFRMSRRHSWGKMSPGLRQSVPLERVSYSWRISSFRLVVILDPNIEADWEEKGLEELLACVFGLKGESLHPDFLVSAFLKRSFNNGF